MLDNYTISIPVEWITAVGIILAGVVVIVTAGHILFRLFVVGMDWLVSRREKKAARIEAAQNQEAQEKREKQEASERKRRAIRDSLPAEWRPLFHVLDSKELRWWELIVSTITEFCNQNLPPIPVKAAEWIVKQVDDKNDNSKNCYQRVQKVSAAIAPFVAQGLMPEIGEAPEWFHHNEDMRKYSSKFKCKYWRDVWDKCTATDHAAAQGLVEQHCKKLKESCEIIPPMPKQDFEMFLKLTHGYWAARRQLSDVLASFVETV